MYIHVYSINMVCIQSPKGHQRQNSQCRRSGRIKKDGEEEERHSKDEIAKRSPIHPSKTKTQANDNTVGLLPPLPAQIRYKNAKIIRTHAHQQQLKKKKRTRTRQVEKRQQRTSAPEKSKTWATRNPHICLLDPSLFFHLIMPIWGKDEKKVSDKKVKMTKQTESIPSQKSLA